MGRAIATVIKVIGSMRRTGGAKQATADAQVIEIEALRGSRHRADGGIATIERKAEAARREWTSTI